MNSMERAMYESKARFLMLRLAWERGYERQTFSTREERQIPGYNEAWQAGAARRDFDDDQKRSK